MKRIEINPELFNMKTKKKREPIQRPIISPNILKNKLLSRIKAHKKHEIKNPALESSNSADGPKLVDTNEFDDSMSFFNLLSRKADLHKKTLKKSSVLEDTPYVNLDLPADLTQPVYQAPPIQLKAPPNQPPYSNLKNGSRPTYREWNKTMRNTGYSNTPVETAPISVRENKLNELRERIKQKHQSVNTHVSQTNQLAADVYNIISQPVSNPIQISNPIEQIENKVIESVMPNDEKQKLNLDLVNTNSNNTQTNNKGRVISQTIKKTIKRKYTLGKSANNRSVAVLLKDVNSRKNVLKAQRDLKKKSIGDVKQYLRDHNLIRVGSNAPSDVLRKLYESAMMSGEITNNNQDTLLNNLLKEQNIVK
jgi:hypothetical protein